MHRFFALFLVVVFLSSCTQTRVVYRLLPDTKDYKKFPTHKVAASAQPYHYPVHLSNAEETEAHFSTPKYSFNKVFRKTKTHAFLVFHKDTLIYEKYRHNYHRNKIQTVFSISKSVVTLVMMHSLNTGKISSLDEPITRYIHWLPDSLYGQITLNHLLNMQSGLGLKSNKIFDLNNGAAALYYGDDIIKSLERLMVINQAPGKRFKYMDLNVQLLMFAIEAIEQKPFIELFHELVWQKIGAENEALWISDRANKVPYAYSGLSCAPIDLAKIGSIILNQGYACNGQVCSKALIDSLCFTGLANPQLYQKWLWWHSTETVQVSDSILCIPNKNARYFVWEQKAASDIFAEGFRGQYIYLYPEKDLMIIRTGKRYDFGNPLFRDPKKRIFKWPAYLLNGSRNFKVN